MRSRRLAAIVAVAALVVGLLPAVGQAGQAELQLVPPAGQTAIKGGDLVGIEGSADADADVTGEVLRALDAEGDTLETYELAGRVSNDGGTLSGSFSMSCGFIPGCLDGDPQLRASVDRYRVEATVASSAGTHQVVTQELEFDEQDPFITGYFLVAPRRVEVRFSEDVADPQGDRQTDWTVEGSQVLDVTGEGDRRVLVLGAPLDEDATPEVRYSTQTGFPLVGAGEPYLDEAGNDLLARNRFADAADRIAPDPPTIDAVDGTATSRDGDDQAVPVLGDDETPTVTIGSMTDGHTARLFLDDGDGTLEDDRDTLVGEAVASGGSAEVTWPDDLALVDDVHRLFARALDGAACDPNQSSSDDCRNASARSQDALYDLDTVDPLLDDPAFATSGAITVVLSETVVRSDDSAGDADDWVVVNPDGSTGPAVTAVSGDGERRVLETDGPVLDGSTLRYEPAGPRYADPHGNELGDQSITVQRAPLPVARLVDAESPEGSGEGVPSGPFDPAPDPETLPFRIELDEPVPAGADPVEIRVQVMPVDASPEDYTDPGTVTVTIGQGESGADVPVELVGDTLDEVDETVELQVVGSEAVTIAEDVAVGTIRDDDDPPTVSVGDTDVDEGDPGTVDVELNAPSGKDVVVDWTLVADDATPGDDYVEANGSITFAGTQDPDAAPPSETIDVSTLEDELDEADETFRVVLGEVTNATVDDGEGVVTVIDDDPVPSLRITDVETFEGDEARDVALTVTLSEVSGRDVTVSFATEDGSATAGQDYTATTGTLTIPAGASGASFPLEVLGDTTPEEDEALTVTLSQPGNATIADETATVELGNDDGDVPVPTLTVTGGEVDEDTNQPFAFLFPAELPYTFTLSEAADAPVEVAFRTTDDGTATTGDDFEETTGTVTIPAGGTTATTTVDVIDDDLFEGEETVTVEVADPVGANLPGSAATVLVEGTIIDDEGTPSVAFADDAVVVDEGDTATFTVELDGPTGRDVDVDWTTDFDGDAGVADLPEQSGTVTVPAGQATGTFEVTTIDDDAREDDETVSLVLSDPDGARLDDERPTRGQLTIADDEVVVPTITVTGGEGNEVTPGLPSLLSTPIPVPYTIELSETTDRDVTVDVGTGSAGTATAGEDFTGAGATVTIPAGQESQTFDVEVLDDGLFEGDESVELVLTDPRGARLQGGVDALSALGTILDNENPPTVSVGDATVAEGDVATVTVTLSAESGRDVEVDWATDDGVGSADAGDDYVADSGTVELPAGTRSTTFSIQTLDDGEVDPDETIAVTIEVVDDSTATVADGDGTVTITDDDDPVDPDEPPVVGLSGATVDEGDPSPLPLLTMPTPMEFEVQLNRATDEAVTLSYVVTDRDATAGDDYDRPYDGSSGSVTIDARETTATVTVEVTPDLVDEVDEELELAITGVTAGSATVPDGLARTGRITDDDPPATIGFAQGSLDVGVDEGGQVTLTVTRDEPSQRTITVDWATSFDGGASTDDAPAQSGTVTIEPDDTVATFPITTIQDDLDEPTESFSVVLSGPTNAWLDPDDDVATVTISDDDRVLPVLSLAGGTVDEADAEPLGPFEPPLITDLAGGGEEDLLFTLTLEPASEEDVTVRHRTIDTGSTVAGSDYMATSGTTTIPAGETSATVAVDVLDDDLDEFTETVVLELSMVQGATFDTGASTLREPGDVTDDDDPVTVALGDDVEVTEGDPATFTVGLTDVSGKDVPVRVVTADGTARAGEDYTSRVVDLTIPAGATSASVTVPTRDDAVDEDERETAEVRLSVTEDERAVLGRAVASLTIVDDDRAGEVDPDDAVVSLTGASVDEGTPPLPVPLPQGGTDLAFTVSLSQPADGDVVVSYETVAGTAAAGEDFLADSGTVTVPDGADEATVVVEVTPDGLDEFDEELQLRVTGATGDAVVPGGSLARTGRILDDDAAAQLRVGDTTVLEGEVATVEVRLSAASGKPIEVDHDLVAGTATATEDYTDVAGTLTFPPGTTSRTVEVPTLVDGDVELIEQLELRLAGAVNAGIDDPRGTIAIVDLLGGQTAVSLEDVAATEGDEDRVVEVPVVLSNSRRADTTVTWSSQQLTASSDEDYRADGGQVVIPAGATEGAIPVTIVGDELVEGDEELLVLLTEAQGAIITGPTSRVTIEDDDGDQGGDGGDGGDQDGGGDGDSSGGDGDGDGSGGDGQDGSGGDGQDGAGGDGQDGAGGDGGGDDVGSDVGSGDSGQVGGGGADGPGRVAGVAGAPDGRQLPATGGGTGLVVLGLGLLAARRRRD